MSTFITTATGADHYLAGPASTMNDFDIRAIAHALSHINRFTGHTIRPYSVAEHSLLCADIAEHLSVPARGQLCLLMHDAHEAFTGDTSSPAKLAIGTAWTAFEQSQAIPLRKFFRIHLAFVAFRSAIRQCDLMALATERRDVTIWSADANLPWPILDTPGQVVPPADWVNLASAARQHTAPCEWRDRFLERFHALRAKVETEAEAMVLDRYVTNRSAA